jgi:two-component system phosphate regulon sensor histidine kinase PhoR
LLLAAATAAGIAFSGISAWLALSVWLLWSATLWLARPEPQAAGAKPDVSSLSQDIMRDAIEPLGIALLLFDRDRVFAANKAARAALGAHVIGQDGRVALRHPEAVRLLDLPDGEGVVVRGLTGGRSLWQLTRREIDARYWFVELIDRTSEADISRAHTDFVANASHELRTPLAAIIGYVETLAEEPESVDAATAAKFHATVLREARRMQSLVADLMSLSQLEAEKHDTPTERVDLAQLATRIVSEVASVSGKERIEQEGETKDLDVIGDPGQLEQLLRNLIDNAQKYGAPDKPVTVSVSRKAADRVMLQVRDRGPGIAPEHLPHLTRRFYRTDPGRSRASGGTGLGLAIVKHIVERHHGELDIASTLGAGTTVSAGFAPAPSE